MLLTTRFAPPPSFAELIEACPRRPAGAGFSPDIDVCHDVVLDPERPVQERYEALLAWLSRNQPCLFGRFAARGLRGLDIDVAWLDDTDIALGDEHLRFKIQSLRRAWKREASQGRAHGFLVMLNSVKLAHALPGAALVDICRRFADLYFVEFAPVDVDVIYTEAVPLRRNRLSLFRGGANLFYTGAHGTANHDRRVPGGILLSINSVGHWANTQVANGQASDLSEAVDRVMDLALRSIGNGGIGMSPGRSCTWLNRESCPRRLARRRPLTGLPRSIPDDHSQTFYSGLYHTDVLVPDVVTRDVDFSRTDNLWERLEFTYISEEPLAPGHENFGQMHGHSAAYEALYANPWLPVQPVRWPAPEDGLDGRASAA
ncbi:hypothetical protein [Salinarimonas sp.]|uniref:hypothetical protein n=1 Tax=Salinarimonas sp. TaxID=2766526 RepID=UPI00391DFDEF